MEKEKALKQLEELKEKIDKAKEIWIEVLTDIQDNLEFITDAIKENGVIESGCFKYTFEEAKEIAKEGYQLKCSAWDDWVNGETIKKTCHLAWVDGEPFIYSNRLHRGVRNWFTAEEECEDWYIE